MIKVNNNIPDKKSEFIQELKILLSGYLAPIYHKVSVINDGEQLVIQEIFSEHGALPLFLYDKNPLAYLFFNQFNEQHNTDYYGEFVLVVDPSCWSNIRVTFEHNIPMQYIYDKDSTVFLAFHGFKRFIAEQILSQKELIIVDNKLSLDALFQRYLEEVNAVYKQEEENEKKDQKEHIIETIHHFLSAEDLDKMMEYSNHITDEYLIEDEIEYKNTIKKK